VGGCGPVTGNLVKNGRFDAGFMSWHASAGSLSNDDSGGCPNSQSASIPGTYSQCINLTSNTKTSWTISVAGRATSFLCQLNWYSGPDCQSGTSIGGSIVNADAPNDDCWQLTRQTVTVPGGGGAKSMEMFCFGNVDNIYFGP
jgi:hypothetical protein